VPGFALYLLWSRRHRRGDHGGSVRLGAGLLAAGGALRWLGASGDVAWLEAISLLLSLAGLAALWGGRPALHQAAPAIAFLIFMVPLPYRVETALGAPLRRMAVEAGAYALRCCGLPAFGSGNTIVVDEFRIGVVDACDGLGMSYMFLALSVAAALVVRRPLVVRALLVASAIPIALAANVGRIAATGLLSVTVGKGVADLWSTTTWPAG
jgi:exosortase